MTSSNPIFNLRLKPELLEALKQHAESLRRSATSVATEFIEKGLSSPDELPPTLEKHLKQAAEKNGRSLNAEILSRLWTSVEDEGSCKRPAEPSMEKIFLVLAKQEQKMRDMEDLFERRKNWEEVVEKEMEDMKAIKGSLSEIAKQPSKTKPPSAPKPKRR